MQAVPDTALRISRLNFLLLFWKEQVLCVRESVRGGEAVFLADKGSSKASMKVRNMHDD